MKCQFLENKWKELSNIKPYWKWLDKPNVKSYRSLMISEFPIEYERIIRESLFQDIDIERIRDRMVMSAYRNGCLASGKYLYKDQRFYEDKIARHLTDIYYNTENIYDMCNWFYFSYLCRYITYDEFKSKIMWAGASLQLLQFNGVKYKPMDRI